jgi:cytochrome d ubiquinol oxidase subunit II
MAEAVDTGGPSNPHLARAVAAPGAWLGNFAAHHWMISAPVLGLFGPLVALLGLRTRRDLLAFAGSALAVMGIIATVGLSMFPFILPSAIDPASSLTVWNASSSHLTLFIMLVVVVIFLPIVLAYTTWAYRVMFGRVTGDEVRLNPDMY